MKKLVALLSVLFLAVSVFAQNYSLTEPDPSVVGADSAAQALREISLDLFEREGAWLQLYHFQKILIFYMIP